MAKLYFSYAAMNAGKSTLLLQASHNYRERGMQTLVFTSMLYADMDDKSIVSRIGVRSPAELYDRTLDFYDFIARKLEKGALHCVFVDEAQFLTPEQVWQCADLADRVGIPVLCYGLRTDFRGQLFPGSAVLLGIADSLVELKAVCHCGRKASMNLRVDAEGKAVNEGAQTEIGGNDRYVALCRRHFSEALGR
ncbi:MAG: thymidine kinase [Novosphingobium sp.]